MATSSLQKAKAAKNDEFYTQLKDIENELKHYKDQLRDKVIFCNCDDPFESNFFKYFAMNFKALGIKKLITTCYDPSPVANKEIQLSFFGENKEVKHNNKNRNKIISKAYKIELDNISDIDGSGNISILDTKEILLREKAKLDSGEKSKILSYLKDSGDFRSDECVDLLRQADIVITNPPFSLFREYIAQLIEYDKKFLIIGNNNAVTYKEVFKLIQDNRLWLGYNCVRWFQTPKYGLKEGARSSWFTNLLVEKPYIAITPYLTYEKGLKQGLYPKYDNYDAIEVSKVSQIPADYYGAMGVPVTFLEKWVPPIARANRERKRERNMPCSDSTDISRATGRQTNECLSTAKKSMPESLSNEFRIVWTTDRGGDGMLEQIKKPYARYDAPVVNGKGIYKRIIIKRVRDNRGD